MTTQTHMPTATPEAARLPSTIGRVTSRDGTTIGYRELGQGPGLILLHGTMEASQSHLELAEALADTFTVYLPDRRGRGLSGPYARDYRVEDDVDDVDALLAKTGAHDVFGMSTGAIIWLQAALRIPAIRRIAAFEPPLLVNGSAAATSALIRFDREIARGKTAAALITAMQAAQMGPPALNSLPRWMLTPFEVLTQLAMSREDRGSRVGSVSMRELAPTLHYDFELIIDSAGAFEKFGAIRSQVLLLGGGKSPAYLRAGLDALATVLAQARRVEFPGLDHRAAGNTADPMTGRGARPDLIAAELRRFFAF
jgi:pimeloyl-ACP methyl ester carboxylesterase